MEILVFKTNLTPVRLADVGPLLADVPGLVRWNVDLEDCAGCCGSKPPRT